MSYNEIIMFYYRFYNTINAVFFNEIYVFIDVNNPLNFAFNLLKLNVFFDLIFVEFFDKIVPNEGCYASMA